MSLLSPLRALPPRSHSHSLWTLNCRRHCVCVVSVDSRRMCHRRRVSRMAMLITFCPSWSDCDSGRRWSWPRRTRRPRRPRAATAIPLRAAAATVRTNVAVARSGPRRRNVPRARNTKRIASAIRRRTASASGSIGDDRRRSRDLGPDRALDRVPRARAETRSARTDRDRGRVRRPGPDRGRRAGRSEMARRRARDDRAAAATVAAAAAVFLAMLQPILLPPLPPPLWPLSPPRPARAPDAAVRAAAIAPPTLASAPVAAARAATPAPRTPAVAAAAARGTPKITSVDAVAAEVTVAIAPANDAIAMTSGGSDGRRRADDLDPDPDRAANSARRPSGQRWPSFAFA